MDDKYRWHLLKLKHHEYLLSRAFTLFRDQGVEPILIKGWAIAQLYPDRVPRIFIDNDFAVSKDNYEKAARLCELDEFKILSIDLHNEFRHLETGSWAAIYGRSILLDLDDVKVRVPCQEDHLRIICVHWLNDGGANKERLWDIYYAVQNRCGDFDWELCLGALSGVRRRWIICAIGIAHKYLGLEIDDLEFADEARDLPLWLINTIEKEWSSRVRLTSIHLFLDDRRAFVEQLRKRLPPNPIQATIEMEGSFDARSRAYYQIGSFCKRIVPSAKKILGTLMAGAKGNKGK